MLGRDGFWCWVAAGGADPMGWCIAMVAWLMVALCVGLVAWMQSSAGLLWWWYAVQGIGLVGASRMHELVWVGWWQLLNMLHMAMLCGLWCWWKGLGQGAKPSKTWWNNCVWVAGAWAEAPWWCAGSLRHGLTCAECAVAVISSYQAILSFLDVRTYYIGAGNVESRPRQH